MTCRSLDDIQMNLALPGRSGREAFVNKMIKAMCVPLRPEDVASITNYVT